jgi:hypothetical protein
MSGQLKLKAASLGGDITLTPTDTASNLVVTIPAGTSTLVTNATLPTQLNASGSAPIYACRAWVNFNGTGTVAIRASGNVSSITDNGTGDYTVNFTTAMSDANYTALYSIGDNSISNGIAYAQTATFSTTGNRVITANRSTGSAQDQNYVGVSIFR